MMVTYCCSHSIYISTILTTAHNISSKRMAMTP